MVLSTGFNIFGMLIHPHTTGFLLEEPKNNFNDINHIGMFWTVCHLWLYGAPFVSNCYRHWSSLVLQNGKGADRFLYIREGVTEIYLLAMVEYGIRVLLLIKQLGAEFTDFIQSWYADNSIALSMFEKIKLYFNYLKLFRPGCGYYPEPSKTILIAHQNNLEEMKQFGLCHGFQVCTGLCYLCIFIRDDKSKRDWIKVFTLRW